MADAETFRKFFFPTLNSRLLLRIVLLAGISWLIFGFLLIPLHIEGQSMEPTYTDGSFALCNRLQYLFTPPQRGDVVSVRFSGKHVMLLKRIVGLPGDTVSFVNGQLYLNKKPLAEPYVKYNASDWQLEERTVKPGYVYVIGDNRGTPMQQHKFGQVNSMRIIGGVIP